jgi:cytochrome c oxidase subunit IV
MTTGESASAWELWRRNLVIWAALLGLLGLTFCAAYLPLGAFNAPVALSIAAVKAGLLGLFFMELSRSDPLLRLAAGAGFLWVALMFMLALSDYLTRLPVLRH